MRRLGPLCLFALFLLFAPPAAPVSARPTPKGEEELSPDARIDLALSKLGKKAAEKHRALSRWCKSKKMKRTAISHLRLALHLCPDWGRVRLDLGYKKSGGTWVLKRPPDLTKLEDAHPGGADYVTRDGEIRAMRRKGLLSIADDAKRLGLEERSRALVVRALGLAPQDPEARKRLGHVQIVGRWFSQEEAVAIPRNVQCTKMQGVSPIASQVGLQLEGWQSGAWALESSDGPERIKFLLEATRRGEGLCSLMLTGKPTEGQPQGLVVTSLADGARFESLLEKSGLSAAQAANANAMGQIQLGGRLVTAFAVTPDWMVHGQGAMTLWGEADSPPSWLMSGFTDYLSERILGTMITRFVIVEHSAGVQSSAEKAESEQWRLRLRNLALLETDPKCGILFSSSLTGLTSTDVMKAWSMVDYLYGRDPAAFVEFVSAALQGNTLPALRETYSLSPDELDTAWREWIIANG